MALATIHEPTKEGGVTKLLPGPSECSERIEIIEYICPCDEAMIDDFGEGMAGWD